MARLTQFAGRVDGTWRLTEMSIRRARDRGISAEQILDWLKLYCLHMPAIVETMIRNWHKPASVFLDKVLILQVHQDQVAAMLQNSNRFKPFLIGHIPPNWFIVHSDKKKDLEKELVQIGFKLGGEYRLVSTSSQETGNGKS